MALYFFNVINDKVFVDTEGSELPDMQAVRVEAVRTGAEMIAYEDPAMLGTKPWTMNVANATGSIVYALCFQATEYGY